MGSHIRTLERDLLKNEMKRQASTLWGWDAEVQVWSLCTEEISVLAGTKGKQRRSAGVSRVKALFGRKKVHGVAVLFCNCHSPRDFAFAALAERGGDIISGRCGKWIDQW